MSTYLCIDLKSFYASVECTDRHLDPLTTRLVVADTSRTDKTICLAVSPALKEYGIPGRARLFEVKQILKRVEEKTGKHVSFIAAKPRMARYIEKSTEIYEIYTEYISPEDIHVYSIDEVFMDITHYLSLYNCTSEELAEEIIHDVYTHTGITATAGIGDNLYLAKIAMDIMAKHVQPNKHGVRIASLNEESYKKYLWAHRPLTDFWRIGKGIAKRLEKLNIYTMGDIARQSIINEEVLYKELGVDAELLIDHAWGIETCTMKHIKAYQPSAHSIGSGQVLSCPYPYNKARIVVKEMVESLALELSSKGLVCDALVLDIGYDREVMDNATYHGPIKTDRYGRSVPKPAHGTVRLDTATNVSSTLIETVLRLYDHIINKDITVRRLNISAIHVIKAQDVIEQLDFFTDYQKREEDESLQKTLVNIKKKYGKNSVLKGTDLEEGATTIERNKQIGGHKA